MISRCWNKRNTVLEVNKSDHGFNPRMPEIRPATWEILQKLPGKLRWYPKSCRWVRFRGFSFSIGWFFRFRFQPFIFRGVFQFGQIAEITTLWKQGSLKVWTMKFWLVGGWTNPSEKYARQLGNLPQGSGVIIKNVWNHHLATYFGWLEFAVFPLLTSYGITRPAMPPMDQRYCHSLTNQPPKPALFLPGNLQKIGSNAWGEESFDDWFSKDELMGKLPYPDKMVWKPHILQTKSPNSPITVPSKHVLQKYVCWKKDLTNLWNLWSIYASFFRYPPGTYPTWGKGKSSSKVPFYGIC